MTAARLPPALSPATMTGTRRPAISSICAVDPAQGGVGVIDRGREPVLGRQPIVDEHHRAVGALGQATTEQL